MILKKNKGRKTSKFEKYALYLYPKPLLSVITFNPLFIVKN